MGIVKLTPEQLVGLRSKPKLSKFWESYFNQITVELNKVFFNLFRVNTQVRFTHLDIVKIHDYIEHQNQSIIQFFKIQPHNSLGFYTIPYETVDLLLNQLLGGRAVTSKKRDITNVDESIIEIVTARLAKALEMPFTQDNRKMKFNFVDLDQRVVGGRYNGHDEYICVGQYVIEVGSTYYSLDIAFMNNFLNKFSVV